MRLAIAFTAALLATSAWPCSKPDVGVLADLMAQATRTEYLHITSSDYQADIVIAMPAIGSGIEAFRCLTWNVELILPPGVSVKADAEGNAGATSYVGLASNATATFNLATPQQWTWSADRHLRGWLRVKVHYPFDDADMFLSRADGSDVWLYPVSIHLSGRIASSNWPARRPMANAEAELATQRLHGSVAPPSMSMQPPVM